MKKEGGLRTKGIFKKYLPGKPLISVITVVFNGEKFIEDTIKSVISQNYDNIEYLIIDGDSKDGTLGIIKKYEDRIDYWQSEPDSGIFEAMNKGIKLARGDWIHLLNSDDYYLNKEVIAKAVRALDNSGKNFYYFTLIQDFGNFKRIFKHPFNFLTRIKLYYASCIPQPTLFVMRKQYDKVGLYNFREFPIAADDEMIFRLRKKFKPVFVDIPLCVMRQRLDSWANRDIGKNFGDFKRMIIKQGLPPILAEILFRFKVWKYKRTKKLFN